MEEISSKKQMAKFRNFEIGFTDIQKMPVGKGMLEFVTALK